MSAFEKQREKIQNQDGFIAALDQSGGSTPKALRLYGIEEGAYSGDETMFDIIHEMRTRIVTSPGFDGSRILGAILFENTMDRQIAGRPSASYLWDVKKVVPFLKVDKGLAAEVNGVQLMKPMPDLDPLLDRAKENGVFGTKMRSVIKQANAAGVKAVVDQQFEIGQKIIEAGLVPIIEPEVDIHCPDKAEAENLLKAALLTRCRRTHSQVFEAAKMLPMVSSSMALNSSSVCCANKPSVSALEKLATTPWLRASRAFASSRE